MISVCPKCDIPTDPALGDASQCPKCGSVFHADAAKTTDQKPANARLRACRSCGTAVDVNSPVCPACRTLTPARTLPVALTGIAIAVVAIAFIAYLNFGFVSRATLSGDPFSTRAGTSLPISVKQGKSVLDGDVLRSDFSLTNESGTPLEGQLRVELGSAALPIDSAMGGIKHVFTLDEPLPPGQSQTLHWDLEMPGVQLPEYKPNAWQWKFATEDGVVASGP